MATAYDSPRWVKSDSDPYKRLLSRMAIALMLAERQQSSSAQRRELFRLPTVDHRNTEPVGDFQIVHCQTKAAKGDMNPEDYLAHCLVVVMDHN